jgi:hypothetical protein
MVEHTAVNRQVVGSNPTWRVFSYKKWTGGMPGYCGFWDVAKVAELADALDLGSSSFGSRGSSPLFGSLLF